MTGEVPPSGPGEPGDREPRSTWDAPPPVSRSGPSWWNSGLWEEVQFWRDVIANPDNLYSGDIPWRLDPEVPLQTYLIDLLDTPEGGTVDVLDVGSGPVTRVGKAWPGRTVRITAIDPLADEYNRMLEARGFVPAVRTRYGMAEELAGQFPESSFDLVFAHNSLDHVFDPVRALRQAVVVLKPGGHIFLRHNVDEAVRAGYLGLHKWNFRAVDGKLVIWRPGKEIFVHRKLKGIEASGARTWRNPASGIEMVDAWFRRARPRPGWVERLLRRPGSR